MKHILLIIQANASCRRALPLRRAYTQTTMYAETTHTTNMHANTVVSIDPRGTALW